MSTMAFLSGFFPVFEAWKEEIHTPAFVECPVLPFEPIKSVDIPQSGDDIEAGTAVAASLYRRPQQAKSLQEARAAGPLHNKGVELQEAFDNIHRKMRIDVRLIQDADIAEIQADDEKMTMLTAVLLFLLQHQAILLSPHLPSVQT